MENGGDSSPFASMAPTLSIILVTITIIMIRVLYVLYQTGKPLHKRSSQRQSLSTLIVLGSGGHTAEMLNLLSVLQKDRYKPRCYIAAATDNMSLQKALVLEDSLAEQTGIKVAETAQFVQIYRSREVGQSYFTSFWTTLFATAHALWLMIKIKPQVVLCNGPGTCIPLCMTAFLFKVQMTSLCNGDQMVISFLCREYSTSEKTISKWLAPV